MARLLNLDKSPCLENPNNYGLECDHINNDKGQEPCASCNLARQYDDSVSFGIKKFASGQFLPTGADYYKGERKIDYMDSLAQEIGFRSAQSYIEHLLEDGEAVDKIAYRFGVTERAISRRIEKSGRYNL
jgi:hypothetical protein